jgi:hypothetical protein
LIFLYFNFFITFVKPGISIAFYKGHIIFLFSLLGWRANATPPQLDKSPGGRLT